MLFAGRETPDAEAALLIVAETVIRLRKLLEDWQEKR